MSEHKLKLSEEAREANRARFSAAKRIKIPTGTVIVEAKSKKKTK